MTRRMARSLLVLTLLLGTVVYAVAALGVWTPAAHAARVDRIETDVCGNRVTQLPRTLPGGTNLNQLPLDVNCPVNGGWCPWGPCSEPCGGGTQTRTCDCPKQDFGGAACVGPPTQVCSTQSCTCVYGAWANVGCTQGGCAGSTPMRQTRTAPQRGCAPEFQCVADTTGACGCVYGAWADVGCTQGGCFGSTPMRQTRTSTQSGCAAEFQCVASASCASCSDRTQNQGETGVDCGGPCPACTCSCTAWTTWGCGFNCTSDKQYSTRTCTPSGCAAESSCDWYCGCAGTCCNNNGNCDYGEDNGVCPDCPVCGRFGCQSGESCSSCATDCGACPCVYGGWSDVGCTQGGCAGASPMQQTRTSTQSGCAAEFQCVASSSCCQGVADGSYFIGCVTMIDGWWTTTNDACWNGTRVGYGGPIFNCGAPTCCNGQGGSMQTNRDDGCSDEGCVICYEYRCPP